MNTTVNINLGGMAFIINEDAYKSLQNYIHSYEQKYEDKEIAKDVESRLAELFIEYMSKLGRQVIDMADVERAIEQIGEPSAEYQSETATAQPKKKKKIYRDTLNGFIGGVSSGIAAYTGIDTAIVRLLWVLLFICCTAIISLVYILMWIILPDAKTPTQRLEMQGLDITTENIHNESATIIASNRNNGCLSLLGKAFIIISVLCLLFPLLFIILALPAIGISTSGLFAAPLLPKMTAILIILAVLAIVVCPIVALVYLLTGLKDDNKDKNKNKKRIWVYSILAALFLSGIIYLCVNKNTIKDSLENWGETVGYAIDNYNPDMYIDDSFYADIDSFTITLHTVYCGDYAPAISGTANRWSVDAMTKVSDSVWIIKIPSDRYNEIKFQDTKGDWSNEVEFYDADTQSWQKLSNIHLSPNPDQRFDFTCPQLYRWSGCHK